MTDAKQVHRFFKIAEQGNDKSDAQVIWCIEKKSVDVNCTDKNGGNVAHHAVARNRADLLIWLVQHGVNVNHPDKVGRTPLHTAAERGRTEMIEVLLKHGAAAAMQAFDKDGNTPFHVAALSCELQAVKTFIAHGSDPYAPNLHGKTPEQLAISSFRSIPMLGAIRTLLGPPVAPPSDKASDNASTVSESQAASTGISALKTRSVTSAVGAGPGRGDKPENMVLTLHLARKLVAMLGPSNFGAVGAHLTNQLATVEPLINSLHRTLSRQHPPGNIEPHLKHVLATLVELWHHLEKVSKPPTGLARLKRSLSAAGASPKADAELARLDDKLHTGLAHLSMQLFTQGAHHNDGDPDDEDCDDGTEQDQYDQGPSHGTHSLASTSTTSLVLPSKPSNVVRSLLAPTTNHQVQLRRGNNSSTSSTASGSAPQSVSVTPQLSSQLQQGDAYVMVGMERVASEVITLLQNEGGGGVVLLHGMVGVGKTAAARATFERIGRGLEGVLAHWVGLQPGLSTSELLGMQRSVNWMLAGHAPEPLTLEDGRAAIGVLLQGRRVLLAVDGASGSQLEELLPLDLMTLLAPGSILLLTSRNPHAAASLQLPPDSSVLRYLVRPLPDELAAGLFCRRAFGAPWADAQHARTVSEVVEACGGLPLAIEAMALACTLGDCRPDLFRAHENGAPNSLFKSLHEAVDYLSEEEGEALQDIARFLVGADWEAVASYCGAEVLAALERSGLVEREADGAVGVTPVVEAFCEVVHQEMPGEARLVVGQPDEAKSALSEGVRGVCFQGMDLQLQAATQQLLDHRMLLLDGCMLQGQLQWSFQQLQWLSWRGPPMSHSSPAAPMERLVQAGLCVLLLEHLPFESVNLKSMGALQHLTLADMPHLASIEGLPHVPQLTHINLHSCPLLTSLDDLSLAPNLKDLALYSCPSLTPPPPSSTSPANPHLLALNNAAFKRWPALRSLVVEGAWESPFLSIAECPMLQRVVVRGLPRVGLLAVLGCPVVREVSAEQCGSLKKLLGVAQLHDLQVLRLEGVSAMEGVLDLSHMHVLREVVLVGVGSLKVHPAVVRLKAVKSLKLG